MFIENTSPSRNDEQYKILFESNPFPMWIYEMDTLKFLEVNDAAIKTYGYTKEEYLDLTLKDIRPEEEVKLLLDNVKREKSSYQWSEGWRHKKKDGSIIEVEIISHEILYNGVNARFVIAIDVTEKKRAHENFRLVIEASPNAMVLTNKRGIITLINKQTEILFGYIRDELIGKPLDLLIPPRFKNTHRKDELNYFKNPGPREITHRKELYGLHKSGKEIPLEIGLSPLVLDDGLSVIASVIDITERKQTQEKLIQAENRYRSTLEHMAEGFQIIGNDFKYLYINKAAAEHGRKAKVELLGNTMSEVYPGIENTEMFSKLTECLKKKIQITMENEFTYPDGGKSWFILNMEPVPEGVLILSRDITHEKESDEELSLYRNNLEKLVVERTLQLEMKTDELNTSLEQQLKGEENLRLIFECINDYGIIPMDINGFIKDWNTGSEKLTGFKQDEVVGKHFSILFPSEDQLKLLPKKELDVALNQGKVEAEGWRVKKDGTRFWTLSTINVLKDKNGSITGFIKIIKDTTEKMKASEELREHSLKLEELNKELESFSYSVSHDLRAPLRHIAGFIQLLEKNIGSSLETKDKKYFNYITGSVKRMGMLIDDLLSFSRMSRTELIRSNVNLNQLVKECIDDLSDDLKERNVKWNLESLPVVCGDKALLKQVLLNLISNAVKYTSKKEEAIIEIGAISKAREYEFYVKDNGAGFEMKYVDKLFGVFQRLHSDSQFEGTGIGLAIVKKIISRHGGKVWAEGEVDSGAAFYFTLNRIEENYE